MTRPTKPPVQCAQCARGRGSDCLDVGNCQDMRDFYDAGRAAAFAEVRAVLERNGIDAEWGRAFQRYRDMGDDDLNEKENALLDVIKLTEPA